MRPRMAGHTAAVAGLAAVCLTGVLSPPGASARSVTAVGRAVEIQLPAGAGIGLPTLLAVSCPVPGRCTAGGTYRDSLGQYRAMAVAQAGGGWQQATRLALPADAAPQPIGSIHALACARTGPCAGLGGYRPANDRDAAFSVSGRNGTWSPAVVVSLPPDAAASTDGTLLGVACAGPGSCTAVGSYVDQAGHRQGLIATESHGQWAQAKSVAAPLGAGADPQFSLNSVACAGTGFCVVVGTYVDSSGVRQTASTTEVFGHWGRPQGTMLPANAGVTPFAELTSVTCTGPAWCAAVGNYKDNLGNFESMALTGFFGRWSQATEISLPLDATANPFASLNGISCVGIGLCLAVGEYETAGPDQVAMAVATTAGHWQRAAAVQVPANAAAGINQGAELWAVACPWIFSCTAVGDYPGPAGSGLAMAVAVPLL